MALELRRGVWHWRKMIDGHQFARSTKTHDRKLAEQLSTLWEAEAIKEVVLKGTRPMNHHAVMDAFLAERKGRSGHGNASVHLKHFYAIPDQRLSQITAAQLEQVVEKRRESGCAHGTLVVLVGYWNAVVNFAESKKWTTGIKLPRMTPQRTRVRYLTHQEENALFKAMEPSEKYPGKNGGSDAARQTNIDLMLTLLHLGCRYNEAARMKWSQVDLQRGTVLIYRSKGGIDTTMMLSDKLQACFARRKAEAQDDWVFPTKRVRNNNFSWLRGALKRAGIHESDGKVTLHTMRHTFASRMLQSGMHLREVQELLGHRHYASTLIYSHLEAGAAVSRAVDVLNAR